jgi:hypothetical protein
MYTVVNINCSLLDVASCHKDKSFISTLEHFYLPAQRSAHKIAVDIVPLIEKVSL